MKLYPHQKKQNKIVKKTLKKHSHVIYGAPTGYGKSIAALDMVTKLLDKGKRVMILAPRIELVNQLANTFKELSPLVVQGSRRLTGDTTKAMLIITIPQTANRRIKDNANYFGDMDYIIPDECHLFFNIVGLKPNDGIKEIYKRYWDTSKWVGFSATPITASGYRLEGWDESVYKYDISWLIKKGFLSKFEYYGENSINISALKINNKTHEYDESDMNSVVNTATALSAVTNAYFKYAKDKKVIVFAASIEHAGLLVDAFRNEHNIDARVIHSRLKKKELRDNLDEFKKGIYSVIINVQMLTTGFDDPTVESIILARPIGSKRLAMQIYGRVLRYHDDIPYVDIIDLCKVYQTTLLPDDSINWNKEKGTFNSGDENESAFNKEVKCPSCKDTFKLNERKYSRFYENDMLIVQYNCPKCGDIIDEKLSELSTPTEIVKIKTVSEIDYKVKLDAKDVVMQLISIKNKHSDKQTNTYFSHYVVKGCMMSKEVSRFKEALYAYKQGIYTWNKAWGVVMDIYWAYNKN